MRPVSRITKVDMSAAGKRLASNVHSRNGLLLRAGEVLDPSNITQLASWGISHIRIFEDPNARYVEKVPDVKRPGSDERFSYRRLLSIAKLSTSELQKDGIIIKNTVMAGVQEVLNSMKEHPEAMVALTSVDGPGEDYLLRHSVNVCILSVACGCWLGFAEEAARDLGVSALLHDIGMTRIKGLPWKNPRALTPCELHEVKKHTIIGRDILEEIPKLAVAATVAHQHHENSDGSGYPRGLVGGRLHPYTRIVSACDRYEAIASTRVHRRGLGPYRALSAVLADSGKGVDQKAARVLLGNLSLYPVGTRVRLADGMVAWVVAPGSSPVRPVILPMGENTPIDMAGTNLRISASLN